jgi:hypothetical protein
MIRRALLLWSLMMLSVDAQAAFSFEYAQHAGYGGLPIRISIAGTHATLIRQDALAGGVPIGVFRAEITAEQQRRLASAVPDSIDSPVPAVRDSGYFTVRMQVDSRKVDLRISQDPAAQEKARDLMREVGLLETGLSWKPVRAFTLELTPGFAVSFHNIGTEAVRVAFQTLGLTIESIPAAEPPKVPGVTPPSRVWELANGEAALPPALEIAPGASADVHLPLAGPVSPDKLYRARFSARGVTDPAKPDLFGTATSKPVPGAKPTPR